MRGTWLHSTLLLGASAGLLGFVAPQAMAQRKGDAESIRAQLEALKEQVRALEAKLGKSAEPKGKFGKFEGKGKFDPKKFEGKGAPDAAKLREMVRELIRERMKELEGGKGKGFDKKDMFKKFAEGKGFDKKDMAKRFGEMGKGGPPWARGGMGWGGWGRGGFGRGEKGKGPDMGRGKGKKEAPMGRGKGKKEAPMARGGDRGAPASRDAELRRALDQLDRSVQSLRKALEQRGR